MGPFAYIPGMECRHAVYSMKHTVNGELRVNDQIFRFENDMGYMEGDSGTSFPDRYIWTQHFIPEGSVMLAAASIPLAGIRFTGTVGFLFYRNREYRFATYLGASVRKMGERADDAQSTGRHCLSCGVHADARESSAAAYGDGQCRSGV